MSLDTKKSPRRPVDMPSDKPLVEHGEHANLERPGAMLHPRAAALPSTPGKSWQHYTGPAGWR